MLGRFWVGFGDGDAAGGPNLFVYAEIQDDELDFASPGIGADNAWQYDSFEIVWGTYGVSPIAGSTHEGLGEEEEPDYFIRISPRSEVGSSEVTDVTVGDLEEADAQFAPLLGAAGDTTGYRVFARIPTAALAEEGDVAWTAPDANEVQFHPFSVIINDRDAGTRQHNPNWSADWPGFATGWWENPSMWRVLAFVGEDYVATSVADQATVPAQFSLGDAYPNPFNPATSIRFDLSVSEQVRLTVHNLLGQEVAVLVAGERYPAGSHSVTFDGSELSSGTYFYRLEAGDFVATKSVTLVK